jgi:hypothetical protein
MHVTMYSATGEESTANARHAAIMQLKYVHPYVCVKETRLLAVRMKTVGNGWKRTYDTEKRKRSVRDISTFSN